MRRALDDLAGLYRELPQQLSPNDQQRNGNHAGATQAGTREYLACESGQLVLVASGERYELEPGDVVVFRGDQRHSYENPGRKPAVGYSAVLLTPALG